MIFTAGHFPAARTAGAGLGLARDTEAVVFPSKRGFGWVSFISDLGCSEHATEKFKTATRARGASPHISCETAGKAAFSFFFFFFFFHQHPLPAQVWLGEECIKLVGSSE